MIGAYSSTLGRWISRDPIEEQGGLNLYAYVVNNPIAFADPLGLDGSSFVGPPTPVPSMPPGANLDANIQAACNHRNDVTKLVWFRQAVHNKAPWDYKQLGTQYQAFGNFNFGATAAAAGINMQFALQQAGLAQVQAGTSKPEWQQDMNKPPYGDDPVDQMYIMSGYDYFNRHFDKNCKCKDKGGAR